MPDPRLHSRIDQAATRGGIITIIFEWVLDRFGDDDRTRKMHDGVDGMCAQRRCNQFLVGNIALNKWDVFGHCPAKSGDKIIDHHRLVAGILEREDGVATDIACTTGDENFELLGHAIPIAADDDSLVNIYVRIPSENRELRLQKLKKRRL